ncbi:hypothetical protein F4861DRAFT_543310 [Xylaria intraflava]|nr:hypothetical protein F4861DRAFT_543310 [Xylaria intraflava]
MGTTWSAPPSSDPSAPLDNVAPPTDMTDLADSAAAGASPDEPNMPSRSSTRTKVLITAPCPQATELGDPQDIDAPENLNLSLIARGSTTIWQAEEEWAPHSTRTQLRRLLSRNRLQQSEVHLGEAMDPQKFWHEVIKIAPPKPWARTGRVMHFLSLTKPMEQPSNVTLWTKVRDWLDDVNKLGSDLAWKDDLDFDSIKTNYPIWEPELWEAIRIVGDAQDGFGTFPRTLKGKITSAGLSWMTFPSESRIIPRCWRRWARSHHISHRDIHPVSNQTPSAQEDAPTTTHRKGIPSPSSSSAVRHSRRSLTTPTRPSSSCAPTSDAPTLPPLPSGGSVSSPMGPAVSSPAEALRARQHALARQAIRDISKMPTAPAATDQPSRADSSPAGTGRKRTRSDDHLSRPRKALKRLRETVTDPVEPDPDPQDSQGDLHDDIIREVEAFVIKSIRNATLEGPIEGLIEEKIQDALDKLKSDINVAETRRGNRITSMEDKLDLMAPKVRYLMEKSREVLVDGSAQTDSSDYLSSGTQTDMTFHPAHSTTVTRYTTAVSNSSAPPPRSNPSLTQTPLTLNSEPTQITEDADAPEILSPSEQLVLEAIEGPGSIHQDVPEEGPITPQTHTSDPAVAHLRSQSRPTKRRFGPAPWDPEP